MYEIMQLDQEDLVLYYAGTEQCSPLHSWKSIRDHFLFHLVFSGKGVVRVNGQEFHLTAGQGFVFFPGTVTDYQADKEEPWYYGWVGFSGRRAESLLQQIGLDRQNTIYTAQPTKNFIRKVERLINDIARAPHHYLKLATWYYLWYLLDSSKLAEDNKSIKKTPGKEASFFTTYYEAVEYYIQKNYSNPNASIQEMARWLGLSRTHLSSVVRQKYGKSPRDLLIEYRMIKARELLTTTILPVGDIARSVGYEDPLVFSRQFKRFFKKSPKKLRQKQ
jgi:AraC-like DNA-binding protein